MCKNIKFLKICVLQSKENTKYIGIYRRPFDDPHFIFDAGLLSKCTNIRVL